MTSLWKSFLNFGKVMSSPPKLLRKHWAGSAGQLLCAHYRNHSCNPSGRGRLHAKHLADRPNWSCSLPLCSNTFSPSHTTNPHHTQEYQSGGVRVMPVPPNRLHKVTHGLVAGFQTSKPQTRVQSGGSSLRSNRRSALGLSSTATLRGGSLRLKCWVR